MRKGHRVAKVSKTHEDLKEIEKTKGKQRQSKENLRSNFNSRCFFSRYLFYFFGHNSEPHHAFWTKIEGNLPLSLPELPIPIRGLFESNRP